MFKVDTVFKEREVVLKQKRFKKRARDIRNMDISSWHKSGTKEEDDKEGE